MLIARRSSRHVLLLLPLGSSLLLGGCLTGTTGGFGVRPVVAIERSGAPAETVPTESASALRVPQMKVIPVPPRTGGTVLAAFPGSRSRLPPSSGDLVLPLENAVLTSTFGIREHPILGGERAHTGIDLAAPTGTPILASATGTVEAAGPNGGYGNYVRIRHGNGISTAYGHMSGYASGIASGAPVQQGQVIGYVGSTGLSTGPHLHWEVLVRNEPIDPLRIMSGDVRLALSRGNVERSVAELPAGMGGR